MHRALPALAVLLAGCFHVPAPLPDEPVAIFDIAGLQNSSSTHSFEIGAGTPWWRTDLVAKEQRAVRYTAEGPNGTKVESTAASTFPFTHTLRVDSPSAGTWSITIFAENLVDAKLRIVVPAT